MTLKKSILICLVVFGLFGCNEQKPLQKTQCIKEDTPKELDKKIVKKEPLKKEIKKSTTIDKTKKVVDTNTTKTTKKIDCYPTTTIKRTSIVNSKSNVKDFDFDIIKKGYKDDNTLLIVGGIQGDEPGGFVAASLIATHYTIKKGSVWVIPNLNFYSIIKRSRGPYGDMNRKFANLSPKDPEYKIIQRIKNYIVQPEVSFVVNLHDGSGFYRPKYIDKNHQPLKWGQSIVIDQDKLDGVKDYGDLASIALKIKKHINKKLLKKEDIFRVKNTHTKLKKTHEEKEMAKTLTFFAITHGKSAIGHETSKNLSVTKRVYYKLLALEKIMDIMGIKFERKFQLTQKGVHKAINDDIYISLYDDKIKLPLAKIRNRLKYFPVKNDGTIEFIPSNPLMSIIKYNNEYTLYYGNRRVTRLKADYMDYATEKKSISLQVDGKDRKIEFGTVVDVKKVFKIYPIEDYRVNVIGFTNGSKNEINIPITKKQLQKHYSIDKDGLTYRVEFYTKNKFAGMILVRF